MGILKARMEAQIGVNIFNNSKSPQMHKNVGLGGGMGNLKTRMLAQIGKI
jgi:hypothetical protein